MSKAQAARTFGVGATSVKPYAKLVEEGKPLRPGKAPGKKGKLDGGGIDLLEEDLRARPAVTYARRGPICSTSCLLGLRLSKKATLSAGRSNASATLAKRSVGAAERDGWLRAAWRVTG